MTANDQQRTRKPLLLLDVDGVLCPLGPGPAGEELVSGSPHSYVHWSAHLPDRLRRLASAFRLVWATSWEDDANEVLTPALGLPPLPVIRFLDAEPAPGDTYKLGPVRAFVDDRPCAWIDDDLGADCYAWAAARDLPTLLIDARPDVGLTASHVQRLLAWSKTPAHYQG